MKRDLVCIICPRGCRMTAEVTQSGVLVSGNDDFFGVLSSIIHQDKNSLNQIVLDDDRNSMSWESLLSINGGISKII